MNDIRSSSPLRHLDISDDAMAADVVAEKARQLVNAYEHIEDLQGALRELLGLIHIIETNERAVSFAVRESLRTNSCVIDAQELLR
jgi:hypothetical protein